MRTQVAIVGAGPAGLLLSHLLAQRGVESVVVENRARDYVQARIRAGVLKQGTVDTLIDCGVGAGLQRQGLRHDGIYLQWPGDRRRIDFLSLCGRSVWVYGQTQVVRDLIAARLAEGQQLHFEVSHTSLHDLETAWPSVRYVDSTGAAQVIECEVVVGADGFHGVSRPSIPVALQRVWQRDYPFAWLGILADVAPSTDELIYAWHPRGFAMHSMRSTSVSRLYLQVDPTAPTRTGRTTASGPSCPCGCGSTAGPCTTGRSPTRASLPCAASSARRCDTVGCSWSGTPRTSCRRPAPRD